MDVSEYNGNYLCVDIEDQLPRTRLWYKNYRYDLTTITNMPEFGAPGACVGRYYSQFVELHDWLMDVGIRPVLFIPRGCDVHTFDLEAPNIRREILEIFMNELLSNEEVIKLTFFQGFLKDPDWNCPDKHKYEESSDKPKKKRKFHCF